MTEQAERDDRWELGWDLGYAAGFQHGKDLGAEEVFDLRKKLEEANKGSIKFDCLVCPICGKPNSGTGKELCAKVHELEKKLEQAQRENELLKETDTSEWKLGAIRKQRRCVMEITLGNGNVLLQTVTQGTRQGLLLRPNQEKRAIDEALPPDDPRNQPYVPQEGDLVIWCENLSGARVLQDKVNTLALCLNGYEITIENLHGGAE